MSLLKYLISFYFLFTYLSTSIIQPEEEWKKFVIKGEAQGTTYQIVYYFTDSVILKSDINKLFKLIDHSLSIYDSTSLISRFNASTHGILADNLLTTVVKKSLEISRSTNGISDITVLPLVNAWGFGPVKTTSLPDSMHIADIRRCVGYQSLSIVHDSLLKQKPCVAIDVNGIAQGYSVDLLAKFLEKNKVKNYLIEIGGEIRISGRKQPTGDLFTIGIEKPGSDELDREPINKSITLDKGAITTSGNYRKYFSKGGKVFAHLIDPVTGYPFSNELISVTVKAADAITADGYDNALMGMGLKKAFQFLSHNPEIEAYFIFKSEDGTVRDTATAGF
jgi:thiamine biosynthesis lipoprotein